MVWFLTSFVLVPGMLVTNVWGNTLIEKMDNEPLCEYAGFAQSFQMLYLISSYCIIFVYCIFLVTIKETMKRYYVQMESMQDNMPPRRIHNLAHYNVSLLRGRTFNDYCDAIAYSLFIIGKGRIGSRAEAEYLLEERSRR